MNFDSVLKHQGRLSDLYLILFSYYVDSRAHTTSILGKCGIYLIFHEIPKFENGKFQRSTSDNCQTVIGGAALKLQSPSDGITRLHCNQTFLHLSAFRKYQKIGVACFPALTPIMMNVIKKCQRL